MPILFFILALIGTLSAESLDESLRAHIRIDPEGENRVGKITIDDKTSGISQSTWIYVKNALEYYKKQKPAFIILELNTPGGEVFPAQKISDALKEMDIQQGIPVVAFINNWAISAGAMLAYSSRYIAIAKDASMGAAEPVIQDPTATELKTASEKVNSAFRTDFANRAQFFDRNPDIAEAMVDKDVILVLRGGKILKLDAESQIKTDGPAPDVVISHKGKLLTLDAQQLMEFHVADFSLKPVKLEAITPEELVKGKYSALKEPLFTVPFFHAIPQATMDLYQMDWKTQLFVLLANPVVSSALVLMMMIGFYVEINTPGFGVPGTIALTALFLLALSSFSQEIADRLELILLVTGLLILIVDLFVLPTFGLLGLIGTLLFLAGFFGMLLPGLGSIQFEYDSQTFNAAGEMFLNRLVWLSGTLILGVIILAILARYFKPSAGYLKRFVLQGGEQEGYVAGIAQSSLPPVGAEGRAFSELRPSGKVEINGVFYDALSTGRYIEKGAKVTVKRYSGGVIVVEVQ